MNGPKWPFLLILFHIWTRCGRCELFGTGFVPWVELLVQRRLCPIFVSGVGLPDIHEYSAG